MFKIIYGVYNQVTQSDEKLCICDLMFKIILSPSSLMMMYLQRLLGSGLESGYLCFSLGKVEHICVILPQIMEMAVIIFDPFYQSIIMGQVIPTFSWKVGNGSDLRCTNTNLGETNKIQTISWPILSDQQLCRTTRALAVCLAFLTWIILSQDLIQL